MAFAFTAPQVSQGFGYSQPLTSQISGYQRKDFLDDILDSVNKSVEKGQDKVDKISGIADILKLATMFTGGYAPMLNALIGSGEAYLTDQAMKDASKGIKKQSDKGFLSSQLPEYLEDFEKGRKDMLLGNILSTLGSTAFSAYQQGGMIPDSMKVRMGMVDKVSSPTGAAAMSSEDLAEKFLPVETGKLANLTTGTSPKLTAPPIRPNIPFTDSINPMEGMSKINIDPSFFESLAPQQSSSMVAPSMLNINNPLLNIRGQSQGASLIDSILSANTSPRNAFFTEYDRLANPATIPVNIQDLLGY